MITVTFSREIIVPSVTDFVAMYPQYSAAMNSEGSLFDLVVSAEHILAMVVLTERTNLPAVSAVAPIVTAHCSTRGGLTRFRKQFSGAVTSCVMQANGFAKTHRKRAVSAEGWSKGEVYSK